MRLKIFLFSAFLILSFSIQNYSQTSSTYSRFGLGDLEYSFSPKRTAMGQLGYALSDENFISDINPAGWVNLSRTRIEFSVDFNNMFLSNSVETKFYSDAAFKGFTFGFPVSDLYGISVAAGILPITRVSYNIEQRVVSSDPLIIDHTLKYEGSGGLSKLFIGSSYQTPLGISLGASLDYIFGTLSYKSAIEFDIGQISTEYEKSYRPTGFGATFGIISPDLSGLTGNDFITGIRLGASISLENKLTADSILTSLSSTDLDTIYSGSFDIIHPVRYGGGISVVFSDEYLVTVDYFAQPWSDFRIGNSHPASLRDAYKISSGFEYKAEKELGQTFWEQIIWRFGLSFEQTQYKINGQGIDQYSVAGGFSLPLGNNNSVDVGIEYAVRGTTDSELLKEQSVRLNLGVSFGELWFIRHEK
ncbi:MAG: membrane protein [Ignavibacteriaceae bacterium]